MFNRLLISVQENSFSPKFGKYNLLHFSAMLSIFLLSHGSFNLQRKWNQNQIINHCWILCLKGRDLNLVIRSVTACLTICTKFVLGSGTEDIVPDLTLVEGESFWIQGQRYILGSWEGFYIMKVTVRATILPVTCAGVFKLAALGTSMYQTWQHRSMLGKLSLYLHCLGDTARLKLDF